MLNYNNNIIHVLFLIISVTTVLINKGVHGKDGTSVTSRIIEGTDAPRGRYKYSVALRQTKGRRFQVCAGTLIAPDIVMTAAHCDQGVFNLLEAVVNPYFTNAPADAEIKRLLAQRKHPEYGVGANWANDVMLLKLESPSQQPWIRLNTNPLQPIPGIPMSVIGWGTREIKAKNYPGVLQEQGGIKSITNEVCNSFYQDENLPVLEDMLCVTNDTSCQGDSGGPLIIKGGQSGDVQVGIVSWAIGCGDTVFPGVHSRISHLFGWIERTVCEMSNLAPEYMTCAPTSSPTTIPTQTPSSKPSSSPSASPSTLTPTGTPSNTPTGFPTITPVPTRSTADILIRIITDNWANEIGWELKQGTTTVEKRGFGDYVTKGIIEEKLTIDYGLTYNLIVLDSGTDGICCRWGKGSITVFLGDGDIVGNALAYNDGNYTDSTTMTFRASEEGQINLTAPPADTPTASPAPSFSPTVLGACPIVPEGGCSICGEGKCVTNPDAIFRYENQPEAPCGGLQTVGYSGSIDLSFCSFFPRLPELDVCGCAASTYAPSATPTISALPSSSPTVSFKPSVSPSTSMSPTEAVKISVLAVIYTDDFPSETSWSIFQTSDNDVIFDISLGAYDNTTSIRSEHIIDLVQGRNYKFSILDQFGDGMCCQYGNGNASVYYGTEEILSNRLIHLSGNFTSADSRPFTAEPPEGYGTFPPVNPAPISNLCFPGIAKCHVLGKGEVQMKELKLGDSVLVRGGFYERIYSFGHNQAESKSEFLRLTTASTYLELTKDHMVFVEGGHSVPASLIKVGDRVETSSRNYSVVKLIDRVVRKGAFAPFTPSGSIIVNGVAASSYVALQDSETLVIGGFDTNLKFQSLAHSFEIPHRFWCSYISSCLKEQYTVTGISHWVSFPLHVAKWILGQHPSLIFLLSLPLFIILSTLSNLKILTLCLTIGAIFCFSKNRFDLKQNNIKFLS